MSALSSFPAVHLHCWDVGDVDGEGCGGGGGRPGEGCGKGGGAKIHLEAWMVVRWRLVDEVS